MRRLARGKLLQFAAVAALSLVFPAGIQAGSATVENYSNQVLHVAVAYRNYKLGTNVGAEGWTTLRPNQTHVFRAADRDDMHLRVIDEAGKAFNFPKHQQFHPWPVTTQHFRVSKERDDKTLHVLQWGDNLRNTVNLSLLTGKLPPGWSMQPFFRVGADNFKLEIRP